MSDLMNIGVSGLLAYRQALTTTSNNIANANTVGYNRQAVVMQQNVVGGVGVQQVTRLTDSILFGKSLNDNASYSRLNTFQQYANGVDGLMSRSTTSLAQPLQQFFTAVNAVSTNPQDSAARQNMLAAADNLSSTFNSLQSQLDGMQSSVNAQLGEAVSQVNQYAEGIAQLNGQIGLARGSGQTPNALLDQRDQMLTQMSQQLSISTVTQSDGSINVFAAGGQALVVGGTSSPLSLVPNGYDATRAEVAVGTPPVNVNAQISGGAIGGLLDIRKQLLDPTQTSLGRIAAATTQAVNAQNAQGVDLNGNAGGPLFGAISGSAMASASNTGAAAVSVGLQDMTQVSGASYVLHYNGSNWSLTRADTGAGVAMSGAGTAASPFSAAGLSLQVSGAAAAGDSFLIQPTASAAGQVQLATHDPAAIAAAAPVTTAASAANAGTGAIGSATVMDASNPALLNTVTLQFTSATTYSINGSGSFAYTPGAAITVNGWSTSISGAVSAGDSFSIAKTPANSGDNSNANLIGALVGKGTLDGGNNSIATANVALVAQTGSVAQQASARASAAHAIQQQTQTQQSSISGVNLDEEAADLIRFQQAYQAAAQVISAGQSLFQSLLSAVRGG
jgi:flagellar hook-associated protein 1 FlgK